MAQYGLDIEEDLPLLDVKLKQLKNEYDQYFLGSRQREPAMLRAEVQKMINIWVNQTVTHTRHRFRFNNLRARWFSFRRHWDDVLRKIEQGTYERHLFKAKLREREPAGGGARPGGAAAGETHGAGDGALYDAYIAARTACGQGAENLTAEKLQTLLARQEAAIRQKLGCAGVSFKVVVESGKAKLKAVPRP